METRYRMFVVGLLLVATLGLNAQYAATEFRSYPETDEIIAGQGQYDGEVVLVFAEVASVDEQRGEFVVQLRDETVVGVSFAGVVPRPEKGAESHEITVQESTQSVVSSLESGAEVQAYGTLTEGATVLTAERVVVDYHNSQDWRYVLGTSLLGAVFAIGHFVRYWRPSWRRLCFERRGDS